MQWDRGTIISPSRLGRITARSKEEIGNLAADKHEKALAGNVISPQDIGVTYNMIGGTIYDKDWHTILEAEYNYQPIIGLDDVKEMLRQCVTYPLKYPRLYQEGTSTIHTRPFIYTQIHYLTST